MIGETTRLALLDIAELEPLEPIHVKGKREPVIAHRLVAIGSAAEARRQSLAMGALGRNDLALRAKMRRGEVDG